MHFIPLSSFFNPRKNEQRLVAQIFTITLPFSSFPAGVPFLFLTIIDDSIL